MHVFPSTALLVATALAVTQPSQVPIPPAVRVHGVPPVPARIAERLAPYGQFRRAQLLSWHPQRRQVVVSTSSGAAPQVHVVDAPMQVPKSLTHVTGGVSGAAWYGPPGTNWILYRKDTGAAETHQLWRLDAGAAEPILLTDGRSRNGIPVWSRTSGRIAFDSNRRNGKDRDIYVLDPKDPSTSRMVSEVTGSWEVWAWSPDERALLAFEMLPGNDTSLWRIEVDSGTRTLLTEGPPATWSDPQFSPNGKSIYCVSDIGSELPRVWRWEGGEWTPLTRDGDSVEAMALSPDGRTLAVSFDRDASSRIELLDTVSLRPRVTPALPAGQITPPVSVRGVPMLQWHPDGSEVAFTFGSAGTPADVFSINGATGAVTRWTRSAVGGIDPAALPDPEIVRWKSFDGRTISGVLYRPPARFTGPRPVMINIHGGPNDVRERPRFQGRSGYFLDEMGIAILYPNVRGSFGFGRTFEKLDDGTKREDAVKDIGSLLEWIRAQPFLDPKRVMVTGASYGGYMAYAAAMTYPERIRCAFAGAAISDFVTYLERTEPGRQEDRRGEYGDERDPAVRDFLTKISPLGNAPRMRVPLLIAHGRQDARVPVAQAERMYDAVKKNDNPVWMVIYDDEGHENFPRSPANANFNFYTWILFVETFLLN